MVICLIPSGPPIQFDHPGPADQAGLDAAIAPVGQGFGDRSMSWPWSHVRVIAVDVSKGNTIRGISAW